jgi:hypothetical protein
MFWAKPRDNLMIKPKFLAFWCEIGMVVAGILMPSSHARYTPAFCVECCDIIAHCRYVESWDK